MRRHHSISLLSVASLAAVAVAGCGGSGSAPSGPPGSGSKPTQIYRVALSGSAEPNSGASLGRGDAIVAFHGPSVICWRFAHLHGFTDATTAGIAAGGTGRTGRVVIALSSGQRLHHQGCTSTTRPLSQQIIRHPAGYYVNVASARYPSGAVRAQL